MEAEMERLNADCVDGCLKILSFYEDYEATSTYVSEIITSEAPLDTLLSFVKHGLCLLYHDLLNGTGGMVDGKRSKVRLMVQFGVLLKSLRKLACHCGQSRLVIHSSLIACYLYFVKDTRKDTYNLLLTLFNKYEDRRPIILNDIKETIVVLQDYQHLNYDECKKYTKLIVLLMQSIVAIAIDNTTAQSTEKMIALQKHFLNGIQVSQKLVTKWVQMLMELDTGKSKDKAIYLQRFVVNLLGIADVPQFPAAFVILLITLHETIEKMISKKTNGHMKILTLNVATTIIVRINDFIQCAHDENTAFKLVQIIRTDPNNNIIEEADQIKDKNMAEKVLESEGCMIQHMLIQYLKGIVVSLVYGSPLYYFMCLMFRKFVKYYEHEENNGKRSAKRIKLDERVKERRLVEFLKMMVEQYVTELNVDVNKPELKIMYLFSLYRDQRVQEIVQNSVKQIIHMTTEKSISVRYFAVRQLMPLLKSGLTDSSMKIVQIAVSNLLLDRSAPVRESVLTTMASVLSTDDTLFRDNCECVKSRLMDCNLSVRKSAFKLLRDYWKQNRNGCKDLDILCRMLKRINEPEDGMKHLVVDTFTNLWFTPCMTGKKDGLPVLLMKTKEMFHIANLQIGCLLTLVNLVENPSLYILNYRNDQEKRNYENRIKLMKESFTEIFEHETYVKAKDGHVQFFYVLTRLKQSSLLVKHIETMYPFIKQFTCNHIEKNGNSDSSNGLPIVLELVKDIVSADKSTRKYFSNFLNSDIFTRLHGLKDLELFTKIVPIFIYLLGLLATELKIRKILELWWANFEKEEQEIQADKQLFLIGYLIVNFSYCAEVKVKNSTSLEYLFALLIRSGDDKGYGLSVMKLKTLGVLCTKFRSLFTKERNTISGFYFKILTSSGLTSNEEHKAQVLENIYKFLREEEALTMKKEATRVEKTKISEMDEVSDIEVMLCERFRRIAVALYANTNVKLRVATAKYVTFLSKQMLSVPNQLVPYLISMTTDPEESIRIMALSAWRPVMIKCDSFLNAELAEGVRKSYTLRQTLKGETVVRGFRHIGGEIRAISGQVYFELNAKKKKVMLKELVKIFEKQDVSLKEQLFIADNIAHFPYIKSEEVTFVFDLLKPMSKAIDLISKYEKITKCELNDETNTSIESLDSYLRASCEVEIVSCVKLSDWIYFANITILEFYLQKYLKSLSRDIHRRSKENQKPFEPEEIFNALEKNVYEEHVHIDMKIKDALDATIPTFYKLWKLNVELNDEKARNK